jgi:hypothetical protein
MKIKTPLFLDNGTIVYPAGKSFWSEAYKEGVFLVGEYSGNLYDEEGNKSFDWEPYEEVITFGGILTILALRRRFYQEEKAMLDFLSLDDPTATSEVRLRAAGLRQAFADLMSATYVDTNLPETRSAVRNVCDVLQQVGLVEDASYRFMQIMDTPAIWKELPSFVKDKYIAEGITGE